MLGRLVLLLAFLSLLLLVRIFRYRRLLARVRVQAKIASKQFGHEIPVLPRFFPFTFLTLPWDFVAPAKLRKRVTIFGNENLNYWIGKRFLAEPRLPYLYLVTSGGVTVHIADKALIEEALTKQLELGTIRKGIEFYRLLEFIGPNLITTHGSEWTRHRAGCGRAFLGPTTRLFRQVALDQATQLVAHWDESNAGRVQFTVQIGGYDDLQKLTVSVLSGAVFGREVQPFQPSSGPNFAESLQVASSCIHYYALPLLRRAASLVSQAARDSLPAWSAVRQELERGLDSGGSGARHDLTSCLASSEQLTREEKIANAFMVSIAGFETTSRTLDWLLLRLSFEPATQALVADELKDLNNLEEEVTAEQCPWLFACIYEALRLDSPISVLPLVVDKNTVLGAGLALEQDWQIFCRLESMHLGGTWAEPTQFQPQRFYKKNPEDLAWAPFSLGPRKCLGSKIALGEVALTLAVILQHFSLVPVEPPSRCFKALAPRRISKEPRHLLRLGLVRRQPTPS